MTSRAVLAAIEREHKVSFVMGNEEMVDMLLRHRYKHDRQAQSAPVLVESVLVESVFGEDDVEFRLLSGSSECTVVVVPGR